jgi:isopentenyl-diphosphate delta-isomerase
MSGGIDDIGKRKMDHIRICAKEDVETGDPLFNDVTFMHRSTPEIGLEEVNTKVRLLGVGLDAPLMIAAMTGGVKEAKKINRDLASVAEELGIGFGLGSQRAMLKDKKTADTYNVYDVAPTTLLLGNIGIPQLREYGVKPVINIMKKTKVNGVCVHLNPTQEAVQPAGDLDFSEGLEMISELGAEMPVVAKETGNGISREVAMKLKKAGVSAIDVGGLGGTSWVRVENLRGGKGKNFESWGIPTAASVLECGDTGLPLIATGGVRNGVHVAKAITLGATCCGMALPVLRWYVKGGKAEVKQELDNVIKELKIAMFLTGCKDIKELKNKSDVVITGALAGWCYIRGIDVMEFPGRSGRK